AAILITGQSDFILENFRYLHEGSTAGSRYPVDVRDSNCVIVRNPKHQTDGTPADAARLVSFDSYCNYCVVEYSDHDINVARAVDTINDAGAGTSIIRASSQYYGILLPETRLLTEYMLSEPRRQRSFLVDDTIQALKDAGIWEKLGALWVFAAHT